MILTRDQVSTIARHFPAHAVDVQLSQHFDTPRVIAAYYDEDKRLRRDLMVGPSGLILSDYTPRYYRAADGEILAIEED